MALCLSLILLSLISHWQSWKRKNNSKVKEIISELINNSNITVEVWFSMIELCKSMGAEPPKDLAHLSTEPHLLIKFTQCFNMLILNLWVSDKTVPPVYHFSKWVGTRTLGGSRTWFLALPWHCVSYCKGLHKNFCCSFVPCQNSTIYFFQINVWKTDLL